MSHHDPIRKDKTCQNCRHVVEHRFCTNCGQENTNTRKTFHHLFVHFFEDLTHYENAFWKTIRHLLTKPGRLTKEYLSGKRLSYLAPIRLYIFISFITFFLIAVVSPKEEEEAETSPNVVKRTKDVMERLRDSIKLDSAGQSQVKFIRAMADRGYVSQSEADSLEFLTSTGKFKPLKFDPFEDGIRNVRQLDSVRKAAPANEKMSDFEYWVRKRMINVNKHIDADEFTEKYKEAFIHNIPKVLFFYMPIFAFFLWLFNNKKKWFYFDHGIFTLHYFSFLLLIFLIRYLLDAVFSYCGSFGETIGTVIGIPLYLWFFYYFFPAHHRFYGDSRLESFVKGVLLLTINFFLISVILIIYAGYTLLYLH